MRTNEFLSQMVDDATEVYRDELGELGESPEAWRGAMVIIDLLRTTVGTAMEVVLEAGSEEEADQKARICIVLITGLIAAVVEADSKVSHGG